MLTLIMIYKSQINYVGVKEPIHERVGEEVPGVVYLKFTFT